MERNATEENDREEERKIQLLIESIHTLAQLSEEHRKELNNLLNNNTISNENIHTKLQEEIITATTIAKISSKILRLFASYLNHHHN